LGLAGLAGRWQTGAMKKPPKPKTKPKIKPREDTNQTAYRVMQEVIKRSESN
jgi:hypothetical protein